jgi:hypothetical protein
MPPKDAVLAARNERILNALWAGDTPVAIGARENMRPENVRKVAQIARIAGDERAAKRKSGRQGRAGRERA